MPQEPSFGPIDCPWMAAEYDFGNEETKLQTFSFSTFSMELSSQEKSFGGHQYSIEKVEINLSQPQEHFP